MTSPKQQQLACSVCGGAARWFDVVDFNKSCEEARGKFLPLAKIPVYYALCENCQFCFAPDLARWTSDEFRSRIYNDDYVLVDPDYVGERPRANAATLLGMFGQHAASFKHIDYGGGSGLLSRILTESQWRSASYDPLLDSAVDPQSLGKFDLITAFEVFEHVPDVQELMRDLSCLRSRRGIVLFSTLLTDGQIQPQQRLHWWYAAPRNGHISLFSRKSLAVLASRAGLKFGSFSQNFHVFFTEVPLWARHVMRATCIVAGIFAGIFDLFEFAQ